MFFWDFHRSTPLLPPEHRSSKHLADLNKSFPVSQMLKLPTNSLTCRVQMESGFISMTFSLHYFPRFSFCASALEKRAPFRLIVKLIQIILSLIQRELIDRSHPLPSLKVSMVPRGPTWENAQPFCWKSLCLRSCERNSEAAHESQWQPDQSALGITIIITKSWQMAAFQVAKSLGGQSLVTDSGKRSLIYAISSNPSKFAISQIVSDPNHPIAWAVYPRHFFAIQVDSAIHSDFFF